MQGSTGATRRYTWAMHHSHHAVPLPPSYSTPPADASFSDLVNAAYLARVDLSAHGFYRTPDITGFGGARPFNYFTFGAAASEVELDVLTGDWQLLRTDIVMDVGNPINPAIDIGQVGGCSGCPTKCLIGSFTPKPLAPAWRASASPHAGPLAACPLPQLPPRRTSHIPASIQSDPHPLPWAPHMQVEGGFVQGMGWLCMEELIWGDSEHPWVRPGHLFTKGPGFYKIPTANDIPIDFRVSLLENAPNPRAVHSSKVCAAAESGGVGCGRVCVEVGAWAGGRGAAHHMGGWLSILPCTTLVHTGQCASRPVMQAFRTADPAAPPTSSHGARPHSCAPCRPLASRPSTWVPASSLRSRRRRVRRVQRPAVVAPAPRPGSAWTRRPRPSGCAWRVPMS